MYVVEIKLVKKEGEQTHPKQFKEFFDDLVAIFRRDVCERFDIDAAHTTKLDGSGIAFCLKTSIAPFAVISSLDDLIMVEENGRATITYDDREFEVEITYL